MLRSPRLQAVRMDNRVAAWLAERPEGRVHSEFSRACNLAWGAYLISLVPRAYGMMPGGVAVAYAGGFRPGEPVFWDGERLQGAGQTVSLSGAAPWTNQPGGAPAGGWSSFALAPVQALLEALRTGRHAALALLSEGDAPSAAAALTESGHSSGTDSLVGIIMAGRISARSAPDR